MAQAKGAGSMSLLSAASVTNSEEEKGGEIMVNPYLTAFLICSLRAARICPRGVLTRVTCAAQSRQLRGNREERIATTATERGAAETADEREASVGKDDTNAPEKVHMHTRLLMSLL